MMNKDKNKNQKKEVKKSLKYSILDGSAWSVMYGMGEYYLAPFAIALKATNQQIAWLASVPLLIASLFQLVAVRVTNKIKSRKKIILWSVFFQALMWLPMLLVPITVKNYGVWGLIIFATFYFILGTFPSPAWNSLMGDLVPENERGRYFGRRNLITGFVAFISIFTGGMILNYVPNKTSFLGYGIIFLTAGIARLVSWYYMKKMYEPEYTPKKDYFFTLTNFVKRMFRKDNNFGQFVLLYSFMMLAVMIAGPFFTVYMLRDLGFSYLEFTIIMATSAFTTFITMTYWGKYSDVFGNKKVLTATGLMMPIIPILWLFSHNMYYLIIVQCISGFVWAGFNLSAANFIFDTTSPEKRATCVAYFNIFNGIGIFIGATLGGILATVITWKWIFVSSLPIIFLISGIARLLICAAFLPNLQEFRKVRPIRSKDLFIKIFFADPVKGFYYVSYRGIKAIGDNTVGKGKNMLNTIKKETIKERDELLKSTKKIIRDMRRIK